MTCQAACHPMRNSGIEKGAHHSARSQKKWEQRRNLYREALVTLYLTVQGCLHTSQGALPEAKAALTAGTFKRTDRRKGRDGKRGHVAFRWRENISQFLAKVTHWGVYLLQTMELYFANPVQSARLRAKVTHCKCWFLFVMEEHKSLHLRIVTNKCPFGAKLPLGCLF